MDSILSYGFHVTCANLISEFSRFILILSIEFDSIFSDTNSLVSIFRSQPDLLEYHQLMKDYEKDLINKFITAWNDRLNYDLRLSRESDELNKSQLDELSKSQLDDLKKDQLDDLKKSQLDELNKSQLDLIMAMWAKSTRLKYKHVYTQNKNPNSPSNQTD